VPELDFRCRDVSLGSDTLAETVLAKWNGRPKLAHVRGSHKVHVVGVVVVLLAGLAGCGGGDHVGAAAPEAVRGTVRAYLAALAGRQWQRACRLMTERAQRDIADATGRSCEQALSDGAAMAGAELESVRREVAGAQVRIRGTSAWVGPLGGAQQALRLERVRGRWLVTS
jgi:hypothetical protein